MSLLQCQIPSGLVGKSIWLAFRFQSLLDFNSSHWFLYYSKLPSHSYSSLVPRLSVGRGRERSLVLLLDSSKFFLSKSCSCFSGCLSLHIVHPSEEWVGPVEGEFDVPTVLKQQSVICYFPDFFCRVMSKFAIKGLVVPLIFLCSLIQTLTLTLPPNNALLANMSLFTLAF